MGIEGCIGGCRGLANRCGRARGGSGRLFRIGLLSLGILLSVLVEACVFVEPRIGNRPNTDLLETSLRMGESKQADVLAALGQPSGEGNLMLPIDSKPRTIWSYYYQDHQGGHLRRIFLFVFFNQDRYDGYMWFSSLPK